MHNSGNQQYHYQYSPQICSTSSRQTSLECQTPQGPSGPEPRALERLHHHDVPDQVRYFRVPRVRSSRVLVVNVTGHFARAG